MSNYDTALIVIHEGQTYIYGAPKGAAGVIWEVASGLFGGPVDPRFIEHSPIQAVVQQLAEPPADPRYGTLILNFDTRTIDDRNGYSWAAHVLSVSKFHTSLESALAGTPADPLLVSLDSIRTHAAAGRIALTDASGAILERLPAGATIEALNDRLVAHHKHMRSGEAPFAQAVAVDLPADWTVHNALSADR